ncbi:MAG: winged helix-turn-helix domain-containing protein [Planctomycetes bacterium]|nr:winged helix-turn-helix domain-containing protein [Planctomycetota bacterium]
MATKKTTTKKAPSKRAKTSDGRATTTAKRKAKSKGIPTKESQGNSKRTNLLDAAASVLADAANSMSCGEMIDAILKRRLWTTQGKTPAATLSSAIIRDIKKNGKQSRFVKADRGRFQRSKVASSGR